MDLLVPGEVIAHNIETDNRTIVVTNRRLILLESDGAYSVIPASGLSAVEVSDSGDGGRFVKLYFGGGLSRTIKTRSAEDAAAIAGAGAAR